MTILGNISRIMLISGWKFFLLLVVGLNFVSLNAQKVSVDRIESDGRHQIMTASKEYKIDDATYNFCLKIYESDSNIDWCLLISSFFYIPDQSKVLLKLGNNEILYLPVNNVHIGKVTVPSYSYVIGSIITSSPSREADYYSSVYDISVSDLDKIERYGIKKIRISNGVKHRDKEFSSNSLGKFINKCRKNIKERLQNPIGRKGLYDNF